MSNAEVIIMHNLRGPHQYGNGKHGDGVQINSWRDLSNPHYIKRTLFKVKMYCMDSVSILLI